MTNYLNRGKIIKIIFSTFISINLFLLCNRKNFFHILANNLAMFLGLFSRVKLMFDI